MVKILGQSGAKCDIVDNDGLNVINYMFENNIDNTNAFDASTTLSILTSLVQDWHFNIHSTDSRGLTLLDTAIKTNQTWAIQNI